MKKLILTLALLLTATSVKAVEIPKISINEAILEEQKMLGCPFYKIHGQSFMVQAKQRGMSLERIYTSFLFTLYNDLFWKQVKEPNHRLFLAEHMLFMIETVDTPEHPHRQALAEYAQALIIYCESLYRSR